MSVALVSGPAPVVLLAQAKAHLQVTTTADDALITSMIAAAQGTIDGPDGWLGRAIGVQTLALTPDPITTPCAWGDGIQVPYPKIRSIESVTYLAAPGGSPVTLPDSAYALSPKGVLMPTSNGWPWSVSQRDSVVVTYEAGYDPDKVPAPITMAILLMVQDLYSKRGKSDPTLSVDTVIGVQSQQFNPVGAAILTDTAMALLRPLRIWTL